MVGADGGGVQGAHADPWKGRRPAPLAHAGLRGALPGWFWHARRPPAAAHGPTKAGRRLHRGAWGWGHPHARTGGQGQAVCCSAGDAARCAAKMPFSAKNGHFFGPERPSRRRAVGALGRDWSGQMGGGAGGAWGHPGRVFGRRQPTTQGRGMCRWGWFWRTGRPPAAFCGPIRTGLRSHSGAQGKDQPFACMGIQGWAAGCPAGDGMWVNANGLRTLKSVIF